MICENFKYPKLLQYFEEISAIPRASYHEEQVVEYLIDFAEQRGLEYYYDKYGNVLINMPATKGYEDRAPILLQGHTDMVCEKNIGCEHDFSCDPLELFVEDGLIGARGTTLGADDGVAVAVMLAILDGACDEHPALQCLFTASEEVGLDGARNFDYSRIFARKMINMDGAEENLLIVGCAGGVRSDALFEIDYAERIYSTEVKISIGGLMGGHSGENIHEGRANANKLAAALLDKILEESDAELISFDGGSKDNAIPREAILLIATDAPEDVERIAKTFADSLESTLCHEDRDFFIRCDIIGKSDAEHVFSNDFTRGILDFSDSIENGVLRMSDKIDGLVEFSRNLGIVKTENGKIGFYYSSRSAKDTQLDGSMEQIDREVRALGGEVVHHSRYPGWDFCGYSELAETYITFAKELFGTNVKKCALHAGLECGIVKQAIPDIEIISVGADITDLHSPKERLGLESFERFFAVVVATVKN